jgi:hypothetical protein
MSRTLPFALAAWLASLPAQAADMGFSCQRFKSSCAGGACAAMAEGLKQDTTRSILGLRKTQRVAYRISEANAYETIETTLRGEASAKKLETRYGSVKAGETSLTLENRNAKGVVSESVEISLSDGFYSNYVLHTDGSIKEVPIGEPYIAYFGWCDPATSTAAP